MIPMMLIIALGLLPPEPITVDPWTYQGPVIEPWHIIEPDGYTTSGGGEE